MYEYKQFRPEWHKFNEAGGIQWVKPGVAQNLSKIFGDACIANTGRKRS
jgi:hypothetical protein